jgi:hypothetical protein
MDRNDAAKSVSQNRRNLDPDAKRILQQKSLSAGLMHAAFSDELQDISLKQLRESIVDLSSLFPLHDADLALVKSEKIPMLDTEDIQAQGNVYFDSRFLVKDWPAADKKTLVVFNIEMQSGRFSTEYLLKRIQYYQSRLSDSQKNREFLHDHYENMLPIRMLWIFPFRSEKEDHVIIINPP